MRLAVERVRISKSADPGGASDLDQGHPEPRPDFENPKGAA